MRLKWSRQSILRFKIFRASGEAILGTQRYFSKRFPIRIFQACAPLHLLMQLFCKPVRRYILICICFSMHFTIKNFSRLRRGDFRYTETFYNSILLFKFVRASGEAILDTLTYFTIAFCYFFSRPRRGHFRYTKIFHCRF